MRNEERQNRYILLCTWCVWIFILTHGAAASPGKKIGADGDAPPSAPSDPLTITLSMQQKPLADVLSSIRRQADVEVTGLEGRFGEKITFAAEDEPVETTIKRLLRSLGEPNYAFLYNVTRLRRVSVVPSLKGAVQIPAEPDFSVLPVEPLDEKPLVPDDLERAVRVINVNQGTQAADADVREGDLVVEYDGTPIQNSQQLISIVKRKSSADTVEMVVLREGETMRMTLKGGLIGINVKTVSVPKAALGQSQ